VKPRFAPDRLRIVVLGFIVRGPLGGMVWSNLHYLMGLLRLGHDVYFLEDSDDYVSCYDPARGAFTTDPTFGLAFAARVLAGIGMAGRWAYHDAHTGTWRGPCAERMIDICALADMVLNLAGVNPLRPWLREVPTRVLVDEDPAFTQVRHLTDSRARERAAEHTAFFSFGENVGHPSSRIPDDGFPWQPTRQPVVLDAVPATPGPRDGRFTTVMLWESYPPLEYAGQRYGLKSQSFGDYLSMPLRTGERLEVAVGGPDVPREDLARHGWHVRDSQTPTRDLWTYERYIRESKAEFSVAKHGYVVGHSGWFSERSACYLASGRPVVVQDTGFSRWMDVGRGVLAFQTIEEALRGVAEVDAHYEAQCRAGRGVAETYFDARRILPALLEAAIGTAPRTGTPLSGMERR
jgi:hypothetical protein